MVTKRVDWRTRLMLILAVFVVVGFIPWESWFPIEIRNATLRGLTNGELGCGALFLLACFGFGRLLNRVKGVAQGFLFLLTPFLIIGTAIALLLSMFFTRLDWNDVAVYKNGDEYLVIQKFDELSTQSNETCRMVRTSSATGMIRWIDEQHPLNERDSRYIDIKDSVTFSNKTWRKIQVDEEP